MRTFTPKFIHGSFGGRLLGLLLGVYSVSKFGYPSVFLIFSVLAGVMVDYIIMNYIAPARFQKFFRQNLSVDIISLCAKMCKAKGTVEREDIEMCDRFFDVSPHHRRLVAEVFDDARTEF